VIQPSARERKALEHLLHTEQDDVANIRPGLIGARTINLLLKKRWIERVPDCPRGKNLVRITDDGKEALNGRCLPATCRQEAKDDI
jgi:hypothetical protein